jgi:hypothetical protein
MNINALRWFDWRVWVWAFTDSTGWRNTLCRMRGHPAGPRWYTSDPEATEPDMTCMNCDERMG